MQFNNNTQAAISTSSGLEFASMHGGTGRFQANSYEGVQKLTQLHTHADSGTCRQASLCWQGTQAHS